MIIKEKLIGSKSSSSLADRLADLDREVKEIKLLTASKEIEQPKDEATTKTLNAENKNLKTDQTFFANTSKHLIQDSRQKEQRLKLKKSASDTKHEAGLIIKNFKNNKESLKKERATKMETMYKQRKKSEDLYIKTCLSDQTPEKRKESESWMNKTRNDEIGNIQQSYAHKMKKLLAAKNEKLAKIKEEEENISILPGVIVPTEPARGAEKSPRPHNKSSLPSITTEAERKRLLTTYLDSLMSEENHSIATELDENKNIIVKINTGTAIGSYMDRRKLTLRLQNDLIEYNQESSKENDNKENIVITKDSLKKPGTAGFIRIEIPLKLPDSTNIFKATTADPFNLDKHKKIAIELEKTIKGFYKEKQQSRCFGRV